MPVLLLGSRFVKRAEKARVEQDHLIDAARLVQLLERAFRGLENGGGHARDRPRQRLRLDLAAQ